MLSFAAVVSRIDIKKTDRSFPKIICIRLMYRVGAKGQKRGACGAYTGIGSASMEVAFLDSMIKDRIAANIHKASGGKMDMGELSANRSAFLFRAGRLQTLMDDLPMIQ